jgi:hypothetical protein
MEYYVVSSRNNPESNISPLIGEVGLEYLVSREARAAVAFRSLGSPPTKADIGCDKLHHVRSAVRSTHPGKVSYIMC